MAHAPARLMDRPILALTRSPSPVSAGAPPATVDGRNMRLLVQLRWVAVGGQLVTILAVHYGLGVPLPLWPMLAVVAGLAVTNPMVRYALYHRPIGQTAVLGSLLVDALALTIQLWLSGGTANPFISFFLLQLVLGAILLSPGRVAVLVAVTAAAYALLGVQAHPLAWPAALEGQVRGLLAAGTWISFVLTGGLLAAFVTRVIRNLRARDAHVAELSQRATEEDAIVRMGLLASGAAHELGTPLSSLSVILNDWRRLPVVASDPVLSAELAEMEQGVARCKAIVGDILHSVGAPRGEAFEIVAADAFVADVAEGWRRSHPGVDLTCRTEGLAGVALAAEPAVRQVVASLLDNAAEASPGAVELSVSRTGEGVEFLVRDRGPGFPPALLALIGRPSQSSKGAGRGLGLFLAGALARRLNGRLSAANRPDGGAEVRLVLPLALDTSGAPS